jgi:outer membrane cobalamin receptor
MVMPSFGQPSETGSSALVYSVNRTPERTFETARAVKVITSEDIWRLNARNLPELLMEQAGIFVQQTNTGGGSPIIRGFIGKDILILVDGVKVNTATYRYGPIQYLSAIDLNSVERIEIVRGVESVLTSYALGGIINIITKKGPPADHRKPFGGSFFSRYSSADKGVTEHAVLYGEKKRFRYYGGATYRKSKDVKGGGDMGAQAWTGYGEMAGDVNVDYFPSDDKMVTFNYMILEQNDVPRTDKFGSELKYNFDPQRLQLAKLAYQDLVSRAWADFMRVTLSWNRQDEGLERILKDKPNTTRIYNDDQTAPGPVGEPIQSPGMKYRPWERSISQAMVPTSPVPFTPFFSGAADLMERAAGVFNGLSFFDKNGNSLQDKGEPNVLQRKNIGDATIKGVEVDFSCSLQPRFTVFGNDTWTKGEDVNANVPLSRIPPDFGTIGLRWSAKTKMMPWIEFICHAADSQKELNPADKSDTRIGPNGTAGFRVFNVRSGVSLSNHFRFVLNLENILDEKYKYHGSGVYRPGFQVVTCAEIRL